MWIYIVYSAPAFSNRIEIHEFFDSEKDASLFIKNHEYSESLEYYSFSNAFSKDIKLIKGLNKEILTIDESLVEYFWDILHHLLKFDKEDSMESRFQKNILIESINELRLRLKSIRAMRRGKHAFL